MPELPPPVEQPLWRYSSATRRAALAPFVGHRVRLERWYNRVSAQGDRVYYGVLLEVAVSTLGLPIPLAILREEEGGTVWAISSAQIASIRAIGDPE